MLFGNALNLCINVYNKAIKNNSVDFYELIEKNL